MFLSGNAAVHSVASTLLGSCLSVLVRWFPAFQHFADWALGVAGEGVVGGVGGGDVRLGLVELSELLPPFCSRRITLPSFRLPPSQHGGGCGSVPDANPPTPRLSQTPPQLVSLQFLTPRVSEPATATATETGARF